MTNDARGNTFHKKTTKDEIKHKIKECWANRSPEEVKSIGNKISSKRLGKPTSKKGKPDGPKPGTSKAHKGRISPNKGKGKKIIQYDLEGNFIKEWPNTVKASQSVSVSDVSIDQCLKGKSKKSAGYIWKYWTENYPKQLTKKEIEYINKPTNGLHRSRTNKEKNSISESHKGMKKDWVSKTLSKPVAQYSKDGTFITKYSSITEAAKAVGGFAENISNVCKGNGKSSAGYVWQYLSSE